MAMLDNSSPDGKKKKELGFPTAKMSKLCMVLILNVKIGSSGLIPVTKRKELFGPHWAQETDSLRGIEQFPGFKKVGPRVIF